MNFLEWQRVIPVYKAAKVEVQVPVKANFLGFFLTACLRFDLKQNTRSNLQMITGKFVEIK